MTDGADPISPPTSGGSEFSDISDMSSVIGEVIDEVIEENARGYMMVQCQHFVADSMQTRLAENRINANNANNRPLTMDITWRDPNIPRGFLRASGAHGRRAAGWIHAGLINLGSLLGVGRWGGLPRIHETLSELAMDPTSGADIIVSIIYQYSPKALTDFFTASAFRFVHRYDKIDPNKVLGDFQRFAIIRKDFHITAGFLNEPAGDGGPPEQWNSFVEYDLRPRRNGQIWWRQLYLQEEGEVGEEEWDFSREKPATPLEREYWELQAVATLSPALVQRRWVSRPGVSQVEVQFYQDAATLASRPAPDDGGSRYQDDEEMGGQSAGETIVVNADLMAAALRSQAARDEATPRTVNLIRDANNVNVFAALPHLDDHRGCMNKAIQLALASSVVDDDGNGSTGGDTKKDGGDLGFPDMKPAVNVDDGRRARTHSTSSGEAEVIPGSDEFDDVAELLRVADAEPKEAERSPDGGHL